MYKNGGFSLHFFLICGELNIYQNKPKPQTKKIL